MHPIPFIVSLDGCVLSLCCLTMICAEKETPNVTQDRVSLQSIEGLPTFSPVGDGQLISAANLANFVRILALNSNLVSQIFVATNGRETGTPYSYTSNWVSRLQHIERARAKVETTNSKELLASTESAGGISTEVESRDQTAYDISRF